MADTLTVDAIHLKLSGWTIPWHDATPHNGSRQRGRLPQGGHVWMPPYVQVLLKRVGVW